MVAAGAPPVTGTTNVPGLNRDVDYEVTAERIDGTRQIKFRIRVRKAVTDTGGHFSFFACAMVQTRFDEMEMPQYEVSKENGSWKCEGTGTVNRRPGWHFGCTEISTTGGDDAGWVTAYDVTSEPLDRDFTDQDIASVYWDLLKPCPGGPPNCPGAGLLPVNNNVSPNEPFFEDVANIWGARCRPTFEGEPFADSRCASSGSYCSVGHVETGNWFTMAFPGSYASRLRGQLTNAPPGATLAIRLPGQSSQDIVISANGTASVDLPFTIENDSSLAANDMRFALISTTLPAEDLITRFEGEVVAEPPRNDLYVPGQHMYGIDAVFVHDRSAPTFGPVNVTPAGKSTALTVRATVSDSATEPLVAWAHVRGAGQDLVLPLEPEEISETEHVVTFSATQPGLKPGTYEVTVGAKDTGGNVAEATPVTAELSGCGCRSVGGSSAWGLLAAFALLFSRRRGAR